MRRIYSSCVPIFLVICWLAQFSMPPKALADSYTFAVNGSSQEPLTAFSLCLGQGLRPVNVLTISFPLADSQGQTSLPELSVGSQIQSVTIDAYKSENGVLTLVGTFEFDQDQVESISFGTPESGVRLENVSFAYRSETSTFAGGGGPGTTPTPEPSGFDLLGAGLICVACLTRFVTYRMR
ncbi:MAG TPA: hypothetical protein VG075_10780 [Candidatus Acidoferrum sp.]|jgi:hypothetical protein|nr:hypothetical protein [Candidatus Acidoferrum sp.]